MGLSLFDHEVTNVQKHAIMKVTQKIKRTSECMKRANAESINNDPSFEMIPYQLGESEVLFSGFLKETFLCLWSESH